MPLEEIRKRARILVIDDSEFFYLDLFRRDGYTVEKWDDLYDLPKLESGYYDLLLLDIQGVGKAQSADEGLGVIRHLKKVRPTQIVVAYSNADWSLKHKEFFDLANATLDKRGDYVEFKRVVDQLLGDRFSLGFYVNTIADVLGQTVVDEVKLRSTTRKAILRRDPGILHRFLDRNHIDEDAINLALQVVQTGIGILTLFLH